MKSFDLNAATNVLLIVVALTMGGMATYRFIEGQSAGETAVSGVPKLVGKTLPGFAATGLAGDTLEIPVQDSLPTILYVFSSTCRACEVNEPSWTALTDSLSGTVHAIAMSLESPSALLDAYTDTMPNYRVATLPLSAQRAGIGDAYRLWATPLTFILDRDGRVAEAVVGAYQGDQVTHLISQARLLTQ